MPTAFSQLNEGWNAEPNSPCPTVQVEGTVLRLSFDLNPYIFPFEEDSKATLEFSGCWRYRLGSTNDEGWYRGQCRFSGLAPRWGEFYELTGDLMVEKVSGWKLIAQAPDSPARHFLFYFRDETFECDAADWSVHLPPQRRQ